MRKLITISMALVIASALPAPAQFGGLGKLKDKISPYESKAKELNDINKDWTPEDEEGIGEAASAKLIHAFGLFDDAAMTKYVNLVGNTVAKQGTRTGVQYKFAILNTDSLNALALPGGFIFITKGALANMKNEAELAGVLAHEVAHVDGRHRERELKKAGNFGFLAKEGKEQGQKMSKDEYTRYIAGKLGDVMVKAVATLPYSSGDESEADKKGLEFAAKAGYASSGLRDFLQVLAAASANANNARALGAWQQTHPPFPERVQNLTKLMANYPAGGQTLDARFKQHVNDNAFASASASASSPGSSAGATETVAAAANSLAPVAAGATEYDGVVRNGAIVLSGGKKLPEGTKVKVVKAQ